MTRRKKAGPLTMRDVEILRYVARGRVRLAHSGKVMLDPVRDGGMALAVSVAPLLFHGLVDPVQRGDHYRPNDAGRRFLEADDASNGSAEVVTTYLP